MSFTYQPVPRGDVVELRPLRSEDFSDLYDVASGPRHGRSVREVCKQLGVTDKT